jgi:chloramphenicol 3-O phosphotransferase
MRQSSEVSMNTPTRPTETKGHVIFLNGSSSAGKTSIAKVLQRILDEPALHMTFDSFIAMLPEHGVFDQARETEAFFRMIPGFHRAMAALASCKLVLIIDHVLQERAWLHECVEVLAEYTVFFVGVHCPLEELERREQTRGDRMLGLAKYQFARAHQHSCYDLEVETFYTSAEACAQQIKTAWQARVAPQAFQWLLVQQRPDQNEQPTTVAG